MSMTKSALTLGFLLLAGNIALANPQQRVVTLAGPAGTGAEWQPKLLVREQRAGSGEDHPILYVHGFTFSSALSVFWKIDGRSWADALNEAGFSVWGFDFAGYGGSERYPEMQTAQSRQGPPIGAPEDAAEQIARVVSYILEQTKAARVSIVAHSIGTIPVGLFATRHPELIDRIVFFGPATQRNLTWLPGGLPSASAALPQWRHVTVKDQFDRFVQEVPKEHEPVLLDFQTWAGAFLASDPASSTRDPASVKVPNGPLAGLIDAWTGKLAYDPVGIKSPLLVVRGAWDTLNTEQDARWLLAAATSRPDTKYVEVPEASHLMLLERNRDALYRATNAFLLGGVRPKNGTIMAPKKSLFAVVFEAKPNPAESSAYSDIAAELAPELRKIEGFLENPRYRSRSNNGFVLSLSLWDSEKALVRWRSQKIHREDQAKGRAGVLSDYHLRVGEVTQAAGKFADRDVGWVRQDETEVGAAKALVIIDGAMSEGVASRITQGVRIGERGAVSSEVFEHQTERGRLALLSAWETQSQAQEYVSSVEPAVAGAKLDAYVIRVIRDYGLKDRREAPQFHD